MENPVNTRTSYHPTGLATPHVLMVTPYYFPHQGGVETHTYEVPRRLVGMGMQPTVLTIDTSGALPARETIEGVTVRRITAWPKGRNSYFTPQIGRIKDHGIGISTSGPTRQPTPTIGAGRS